MKKPRKPPKPKNVMAQALSLGQYQPKVVKSKKAYTRKVPIKDPLED